MPEADQYQKILDELRRVNDAITDEEMTDKISRLEAVSAKIFEQARTDPDKLPQMRKFMDYYLPTSLKLLNTYAEHEFRNILTDDLDLATEEEKKAAEEKAKAFQSGVDFLKESLGEKVKDVRVSTELGSHAVTMVPDGGMSFEMEKYMHTVAPSSDYHCGRILEVNPEHPLLQRLSESRESDPERAKKLAELLYDQGLLMANLPLEDPTAYTDLVCELIG